MDEQGAEPIGRFALRHPHLLVTGLIAALILGVVAVKGVDDYLHSDVFVSVHTKYDGSVTECHGVGILGPYGVRKGDAFDRLLGGTVTLFDQAGDQIASSSFDEDSIGRALESPYCRGSLKFESVRRQPQYSVKLALPDGTSYSEVLRVGEDRRLDWYIDGKYPSRTSHLSSGQRRVCAMLFDEGTPNLQDRYVAVLTRIVDALWKASEDGHPDAGDEKEIGDELEQLSTELDLDLEPGEVHDLGRMASHLDRLSLILDQVSRAQSAEGYVKPFSEVGPTWNSLRERCGLDPKKFERFLTPANVNAVEGL